MVSLGSADRPILQRANVAVVVHYRELPFVIHNGKSLPQETITSVHFGREPFDRHIKRSVIGGKSDMNGPGRDVFGMVTEVIPRYASFSCPATTV